MTQIKVIKDVGGISGLCSIEPAVHTDSRGYFFEAYNKREFAEHGLDMEFVQDNQSCSRFGVLRGLHFQKKYPQCKLVRVFSGAVFDVAVDLRHNSTTYGKWYGELLTGDNKKQLLIPKGFAHGYLVLSDSAIFSYKCTDFYHPDDEGGIAWNDPKIAVSWPGVIGEYDGTASASGYTVKGKKLIINAKDECWGCL